LEACIRAYFRRICPQIKPGRPATPEISDGHTRYAEHPRPESGYNSSAAVFGFRMSFPKLFVVGPLRVASFTRAEAAIEEPALHWVARQCERFSEVLARRLVPPAAKLEFAKRR